MIAEQHRILLLDNDEVRQHVPCHLNPAAKTVTLGSRSVAGLPLEALRAAVVMRTRVGRHLRQPRRLLLCIVAPVHMISQEVLSNPAANRAVQKPDVLRWRVDVKINIEPIDSKLQTSQCTIVCRLLL